jgi:recombination associated protein RdgC
MLMRNIVLFKINAWNLDAAKFETLLSGHPLQPCGAMDVESFGWVPPRKSEDGNEPFVFSNQEKDQFLISLGFERKLLPSSVVDQFVSERVDAIEELEGARPGRKRVKEIKETLTLDLLPRAFSVRGSTLAWVDVKNGWLAVNASSAKKAESLVEALVKLDGGSSFSFVIPATADSPSVAMTRWLAGNDVPDGFTIDRDCELLDNTSDEKGSVKYAHHPLDATEIPMQIAAGKTVSKLALTWQDKISFVLCEDFSFKKITFTDFLKKQSESSAESMDEQFSADFLIMAGEVSGLVADVVAALGGLKVVGNGGQPAEPVAGA